MLCIDDMHGYAVMKETRVQSHIAITKLPHFIQPCAGIFTQRVNTLSGKKIQVERLVLIRKFAFRCEFDSQKTNNNPR